MCGDLSLPQQLVQVAHAAQESGLYLPPDSPRTTPDNIIVCMTPDEQSLLAEAAKHDPSIFRLIREPDLQNRATAMATRPLSGLDRKPFRRWRLWNQAAPQSHEEVAFR